MEKDEKKADEKSQSLQYQGKLQTKPNKIPREFIESQSLQYQGKLQTGPSKFLITFRYLQGCFKTDIDPFV